MPRLPIIRFRLTDGERSLLLAFCGVAFFGAGVAFTVVNQLGGSGAILRPLSHYDIWIVLSGAIGACFGLYGCRGWMGHPGVFGIGQALVGILPISFVSAIAAGTLSLPIYGTMFGPLMLATTFLGNPMLAGFWTAILLACHAFFLIWRRERNSIFAEPEDDGIPV